MTASKLKIINFVSLCWFIFAIPTLLASNDTLNTNNINVILSPAYELYSHKEYYKARQILQDFLAKNNHIEEHELTNVYLYLGSIEIQLGNFEQSLVYYNIAEKHISDEFQKAIYIHYNKAIVYRKNGDYNKAEQLLNFSLGVIDKNNFLWRNKMLSELAIVYYNKGEHKLAIELFEQIIQLSNEYNLPELDHIYNSCAYAYQEMGQLNTAESYFYKSIKYSVSNPISQYPIALTYSNLGSLQIRLGKYQEGLNNILKALSIFNSNFDHKHPYKALCYFEIAKYYQLKNQLDSSLVWLQKALIAKVGKFNVELIVMNPEVELIFPDIDILDVLKSKANVLHLRWQQNAILTDLETEMNTYDLLVQLIDKMRINSLMNESKQDLHKRERNTYIKAMQVALELYHQTKNDEYQHKALQLADKLKYSSLMDDMQTARARLKAFVPDSILLTEINLQRRINAHHKLINETNDNDSLVKTNFKSNLFELYQKQDKLNAYVRDSFPDYYSLKNQINELDSRKLQRSLHRKETMLSYTLADSCMYIFVIARNSLSVSRQPLDSAFFKDIKVVKDYLTGKIQNIYNYQLSAHRLYNQLLFPVKENINNHNIIIVPDDITGYLPFEVLLTHSPSGSNHTSFKEMPYLVHKYAIGYSYTASLWAQPGNMSARLSFQYPALSSLDDKWQVEQKDENVAYIPFLNEGIAQFAFNGNTTGTAFRNNQIDPKADIWAVLKKDYNRYMNKGERKSSAMRLAKLDYLSKVPSSGVFNAFGSNAYASPRYWAGYIIISNNNPQNRTPVKAVLLVLLFVLMLAFGMYYVLKPHWQTDQKIERIERIGVTENV